ncbi:MAG: hypothetical protein JW990_06170, partial [Thermoleophilia bacterium]|nr:hypothetical protein [Thermoleophilia bacterium]
MRHPARDTPPLTLPEQATVVVVGGGPAGSFFAIRLLRRARQSGRTVDVVILEKKTEICFYGPVPYSSWEGCNYCAGGVSPRLIDGLRAEGIHIPEEVIESRSTEMVVHGDWKSILLSIPAGREMLSVFRGSRPRQRTGRYVNFDTWLLNLAVDEGARVITAEVDDVHYSNGRRPVVGYQVAAPSEGGPPGDGRGGGSQGSAGPLGPGRLRGAIEADFAVFAGGVNRSPGIDMHDDPVLAALRRMIPRLRPPKVRRAVIAEMQDSTGRMRVIEGEVHFVQYGSEQLHIEMASVMPKKEWITTVLLGKSVDEAAPSA